MHVHGDDLQLRNVVVFVVGDREGDEGEREGASDENKCALARVALFTSSISDAYVRC